MSYYEPQGWQAPAARQVSWEQPVPPSRSGSSSVSQREDIPAFSSQFDEVDRAIDNLVKSGKLWAAPRRDSMPLMMGRPYPDYADSRLPSAPMSQRHHSISEFDGSRVHSGPNTPGFYASQRFQSRPNEVEQMMQAKRRMAAQRERELRNYHQEQQYNRSLLSEMTGNTKPERSISPAAVNEESRRDLLARQHRALYGNESPAFFPATGFPDEVSRPDSQGGAGSTAGASGPSTGAGPGPGAGTGTPTSATGGVRGSSPRGVDPFGLTHTHPHTHTHTPGSTSTDGVVHSALQSPTRANSTSSPSSGINPVFGEHHAVTSPGGAGADSPSSARQAPSSKPMTGPIGSGVGAGVGVGSVGPIGSRPISTSSTMSNPALTKRSTTPLPSPLGYGFSAGGDGGDHAAAGPPTTAATAPGIKDPAGPVGLGWGNGSGVWGSKNGLGVQASVWG